MASHGHRSIPSRTPLTRRTTRGPLDIDDDVPLSIDDSSQQSSTTSAALHQSTRLKSGPIGAEHDQSLLSLDDTARVSGTEHIQRDLTFLLDRSHFHPLSQVDIPTALRKPFPGPPPPGTQSRQILQQIENLVGKGDFLAAAHLSVLCLTSGFIKATDNDSIFKLLATRFSCLEIMGQTMLAAQEAKALEDLGSDFYYVTEQNDESSDSASIKRHIMPFELRVQAIRLQTIGFSDPRRGITMLYDLGHELRANIHALHDSDSHRGELTKRLASISLHVVNSLIEIGDLDCAYRTLLQSKMQKIETVDQDTRITILLLKMGRLQEARTLVDNLPIKAPHTLLNKALLELADGNLDEAIVHLRRGAANAAAEDVSLVKHNLAVALLYAGIVQEAQVIFRQLVDDGHTFSTLVINLSTVFELTSDNAKERKHSLVQHIAGSEKQIPLTNSDFKL